MHLLTGFRKVRFRVKMEEYPHLHR
ncbi:unnamed protein product [Debaryomyces tyrocola]|nr:unnamed protein product [Debaryomyces tyrocola]